MFPDTSYLMLLLIAAAVGLLVPLLAIPVSKRRSRLLADGSDAIWVGMANFRDPAGQEVPAVRDAFSDVGSLYGVTFSKKGDIRPVGGRLWVYGDRISWEPRIWLGRGHARPWQIPIAEVVEVSTRRGIGGHHAELETTSGTIRLEVVDPRGLKGALNLVE